MNNCVNCQNQVPPSYSGVTINITNPALNMSNGINPITGKPYVYQTYEITGVPVNGYQYQALPESTNVQQTPVYNNILPSTDSMYGVHGMIPYNGDLNQSGSLPAEYKNIGSESVKDGHNSGTNNINTTNIYQTNPADTRGLPNTYPSSYYINHYNGLPNGTPEQSRLSLNPSGEYDQKALFATGDMDEEVNTELSKEIIKELNARQAEQKKLEKNSKKKKIVALTDEYIMSLENYLNNPNADVRLMASKEILTRLDEDRNRYNDAALNALLNKMLQDPNKLVRIAALSALSSGLASGNDYTVELVKEIQSNPDADPEDVLEASQILLMHSATEEIKYVPIDNKKEKAEKE